MMLHGVKLPGLGMGLGGRQKSQPLPYQGNLWEASSKMGRWQWDHIYKTKDPYNSCQHRQLELDCEIMVWPSIDHSRDMLPVRIETPLSLSSELPESWSSHCHTRFRFDKKQATKKPPQNSLGLALGGPLVLIESIWDQPTAFICLKEQPCHLSSFVFLYVSGEGLPRCLKPSQGLETSGSGLERPDRTRPMLTEVDQAGRTNPSKLGFRAPASVFQAGH